MSYGSKPHDAPNWRIKLLRENPVDPSRVHFLGKVDYATYRTALQVSAAHIYLTYPFVLSWSLLEALACGCSVITSDTAPVREVIQDGVNGWLVDFFDKEALVGHMLELLANQSNNFMRREAISQSVKVRYSVAQGVKEYLEEIDKALAGSLVASAKRVDDFNIFLNGLVSPVGLGVKVEPF